MADEIPLGGVAVEIRGKLDQLQRDLAQAKVQVDAYDKGTVKSGKAAAQERVRDIKAAIREQTSAFKAAQAQQISAEKAAQRDSVRAVKAAEAEKLAAQKQAQRESLAAQRAAQKAELAATRQAAREKVAAERQAARELAQAERSVKQTNREQRDALRLQERMTDQANRLLSEYDAQAASQLRLNRALTEANRLREKGIIDAKQEAAIVAGAQAQAQQFQKSQASNRRGQLAGHQLTNLSYQANDVITGLASGQPLGQVAAQQGGQIFQILQQSQGGVIGGLKGVAGAVGALITPTTLAATAVLGLAAAFAAVAVRGSETQEMARDFQAQINVVGAAAMGTGASVAGVARNLDAFGGSLKDVKAELSDFLRQGIDPQRLEQFGRASEYVAKVWGDDLATAGANLAKGFSGGYNEIKRLNDLYPFLDASELKQIKNLFEQKDAAEARNLAFAKFNDKYAPEYEQSLSNMDRLQKAVAGSWDTLISALGNTDAVKGATSVIDQLTGSLARYLQQYQSVASMTQSQLRSERDALAGKVRHYDYDAEAKNDLGSGIGAGLAGAASILTHVPVTSKVKSAADRRQADHQRIAEIDAQLSSLNYKGPDTLTPTAAGVVEIEGEKKGKKPKADKLTPDEREVQRAIASAQKAATALGVQNRAQAALNAQIAAGTVTIAEANRRQEIAAKLSEYQSALDKATGDDKATLQSKMAALTAEMVKQQQIESMASVLGLADAQKRENEDLDLQLKLLTATNKERYRALALAEAERQIKDSGLDETSYNGRKAANQLRRGAMAGADGRATLDGASYVQQGEDANAALKAERDIQAATFGMDRRSAAQYRKEQELLNQAKANRIVLTEKEVEAIHAQAVAYGQVSEQMAMLAEREQGIDFLKKDLYELIRSGVKNVHDLSDAFAKLAESIGDAALQAALLGEGPLAGLFGTSGSGGLLGGLGGFLSGSGNPAAGLLPGLSAPMSFGVHHGGGTAGSPSSFRMAPAGLLLQAPRLHSGLAPDEFPAILQKGERVIRKGGPDGGPVSVTMVFPGITSAADVQRNQRQMQAAAGRAIAQALGRG